MTGGESHGKGLMTIVDGVPAGLKIGEASINRDLARRMVGYGRGDRMRIEQDKAEVLSGVRKGMTIGSPVGMVIHNKDYKIDELPDVNNPRPGHADLAGIQKYGLNDARDVLERASARETAARVAAGAVAKLILKECGISVFSHVFMLGGVTADTKGLSYEYIQEIAEASDLRCADKVAAEKMRKEIDKASEIGDTLGGAFEVLVLGVPTGLGSYTQWDRRLDGNIARAVMSIQAIKAVSIGEGILSAGLPGSSVHDTISYDSANGEFIRDTNNAGGLEGGVTNGQPVVVRAYMKPISTLKNALRTVNIRTKKQESASTERSDVTAVAACGVVAEAVVAIETASALLEKFGGDSIAEIKRNVSSYLNGLKKI
jgi:chorismate synthase